MQDQAVSHKSTLSHQQLNELRTIVFKQTYEWFRRLAWSAPHWGFDDEHNRLLDRFSPEQVRRFVWDNFEATFKTSNRGECLPRERYQDARAYLKALTLKTVMQNVGGLEMPGTDEKLPSCDDLRRRHGLGVPYWREKHGLPPLRPYRAMKSASEVTA